MAVNVYGLQRTATKFINAVSLYHPDTAARSLAHDGSGTESGFKDDEGKWDLRPHKGRITNVTDATLATWHAILESTSVPVPQTRMVYAVNEATAAVLGKLSRARRIGELELRFSLGWDEGVDSTEALHRVQVGGPRVVGRRHPAGPTSSRCNAVL